MDAYQTVAGTATARIEEKKSEFIAHISFADTEEKALAFLNAVRAEHRTASHNVYAYLLREGARMRYSDDGEPAKTSGLPTLEAIRHAHLTDCVIVTTRYFGGTLLGTGGLVRAYTAAAGAAIAAARNGAALCARRAARGLRPLRAGPAPFGRGGRAAGGNSVFPLRHHSLCAAVGPGNGAARKPAAAVPRQRGSYLLRAVFCAFRIKKCQ